MFWSPRRGTSGISGVKGGTRGYGYLGYRRCKVQGATGVQEDMDIWGMEGARGVHEDICHRGTSGISGVWKVQGGYKRISGTRGRTRGYPRLKNALIYIEQVQKHPVTKSYIFSNQVSSMPLATAPVISSSVEGVLVRWNYCVRV